VTVTPDLLTNTLQLFFREVEISDMGQYTCQFVYGKGIDIGVLTVRGTEGSDVSPAHAYRWWQPLPSDLETPNFAKAKDKIKLEELPKDELGVHRIARRKKKGPALQKGNYSTGTLPTYYNLSSDTTISY